MEPIRSHVQWFIKQSLMVIYTRVACQAAAQVFTYQGDGGGGGGLDGSGVSVNRRLKSVTRDWHV